MAKQYDRITPGLQSFIEAQPLFFVATAPLSEQGHVNLSPKGHDTFRVLSSTRKTLRGRENRGWHIADFMVQ